MQKKLGPLIFFILIFSLIFTGCANAKQNPVSDEMLKKYGNDVYYFMGLQAINEGDTKSAIKYLRKTVSSKSKLFASLSARKLVSILPEKDATSCAANFYKNFNDEDSLALYLQQLFNQERYDKIISLTKNLDYKSAGDEIVFYQCAALLATDDSSFPGIYNLWCAEKNWSDWHKKILSMIKDYPKNSFAFASDTAKMQDAASKKDWGQAAVYARRILNEKTNLSPQVVSVAGKSLFYGSTNYETNATFLESLLGGSNDVDFYLNFYAARLYSKIDSAFDMSQDFFKKAMACATIDADYDNALWYYLNSALQKDLTQAVDEFKKYCSTWHDPSYFDDILESLSVKLMDEKKWEEYYSLSYCLENYASPETRSAFFYTSGSLIENNFYQPADKTKEEEIKNLYTKALDGGADSYHKLMAAAKLGLSDEETWKYFSFWQKLEDFQADEDVEKIFYGYIEFDFVDLVYPFWLEHSNEIGLECAEAVAEYLHGKIDDDPYFNYISLRVAAKKLNYSEKDLTKKIMEFSFPRGFSDHVEKFSEKYKTDEYLIYALIRMESFYSPEAISHAGATGLCQLMETTAAEVAKKIGLSDYELTDPETNIHLGTYYLAELISRMEKNSLLAVCSYNAGAGKIRSTLRNCLSIVKRSEIPNDIFLEMLNITETRNYGKSVSAAAAIYAYLYYNKSPIEVIKKIVGI